MMYMVPYRTVVDHTRYCQDLPVLERRGWCGLKRVGISNTFNSLEMKRSLHEILPYYFVPSMGEPAAIGAYQVNTTHPTQP
jgi:hypothetical protein